MFGNSSSVETNEIMKSFDSNSDKAINNNEVAFSKKAQNQCDADENLFLRFLELDPPVTNNETPRSYTKGRTPFTITKKLTKGTELSYGFSIVWTHPPRIEKIESNSAAEKAGMLQGDYVIFIDKYNVVTMPELDILNLIRIQGNTLTLEIFRPKARQGSTKSKIFSPKIMSTRVSYTNQDISTDEESSVKPLNVKFSSAATVSNSNASIEMTKKRLKLPQVAGANSKESIQHQQNPESLRKRYLVQLMNREQHFVSAINFGLERFVHPLRDRKDVISINDHRTLFQNIDELMHLSEDILEQILQNDHDPQMHFASRVYLSKSMALCAAYKRYCSGLKRADCVLLNKSRSSDSDFLTFLNEPPIPKKRPDITTFIHRPLQHFRDILKILQLIASNCPVDSDENKNFSSVISELQAAYREITVNGLMEPLVEGRPLLSLQDLESRLVFTKCKPFSLVIPGRQWIFGSDLTRIDGRTVKQFWTLLFSDIMLFAKVSRDRVLFITDEPLPLTNIVDCIFNVKKKTTEFRLVVDPSGQTAKSPANVNCTPDLTRTPLKSVKKRAIILRAPSIELKAVWQNLLTRQISIVNSTLGSQLSSPLESPDIMVSNLNLNDVNMGASSMVATSSKMCSIESIQQPPQRRQQSNQQNKEDSNNNNSNMKTHSSGKTKERMQNLVEERSRESSPKMARQLENFIDEKCSMLSKSGVSKEGSVHLAQWIKGQFNNKDSIPEFEDEGDGNQDWSAEEVEKRSKELRLMHEVKRIEENPSEDEQLSTSKSTSDSQITVRSSPINNNNSRSDSLSICRQCHKFCKKKLRMTNDSNNNQLSQSKRDETPTTCNSSNTTIKEEISADTLTDEGQEIRASQTMVTIKKCTSPDIAEMALKTSQSSPSALQTAAAKSSKKVNIAEQKKEKTMANGICKCECKPKDFEKTTLSPDEVKHEIVKILSDVDQITNRMSIYTDSSSRSSDSYLSYSSIRAKTLLSKYSFLYNNNHMIAATKTQPLNIIKETMIGAQQPQQENKTATSSITTTTAAEEGTVKTVNSSKKEISLVSTNDENISLMLTDLTQSTPITTSIVPAISINPPTPDPKTQHNSQFNLTKDLEITKVNSISIKTESSFDSVDDEEEPPYIKLKTSLRRFGTMSSLERLPSEDTDEKTLNSSDDDSIEELKMNTQLAKDLRDSGENSQLKTWTSRAGSFLEESKAFIDKYLGRTDDYIYLKSDSKDVSNDFDEYETIEGEATSGEEVWGTPSSGGENDEMHMFNNGDGNQTSPKSSSGDEDTEIMMDELLMAPMMTASNIRGLLPRRRLEPLFEEDTDSCDSNNENSLLKNNEGEEIEKNIEKYPSSPTSIDSDQTTPSIDDEMNMNMDEMMSPTTRLAQQDVMSPLEDLEMDEMEVMMSEEEETPKTTTPVETFGSVADKSGAYALYSQIERKEFRNHIGAVEEIRQDQTVVDQVATTSSTQVPSTFRTPRSLEMRLAMNNDILGDEDLINYVPGPNLTSILGHDLSSYHRVMGRDIIMNRIMDRRDISLPSLNSYSQNERKNDQPSSYSQQKNSKMDTPILNRKTKQRIWNNSGFVQKEEKTALSDLEKLARREKIYCMSQHQSTDTEATSSSSTKANKLFKLLRRNSENTAGRRKEHNYSSGDESTSTHSGQSSLINNNSKENDKALILNRRFFKQLTKRRSNTLSDFSSK
ncbi:hypothetical protein PVAND_004015 [Polypedilum vanderplanki]|uniref:Uncharacterized protein n=1 Tax=Polypedilum vanderplanki TaxID=319348 RepID=A0A9J6BWF6_POLVA|nr:hypothetical protein PVAND_004015 [Polypedilum vanderplanki]